MSAGSHTSPGGYTGTGATVTSRSRGENGGATPIKGKAEESEQATRQFDTADGRTPAEVAGCISRLGYEPVWKDWDKALMP